MLLSDIPTFAAHRLPEQVAVRFEERTITYKELRDRCWRLSNALIKVTVPGDRVAILAENCPEYVECYYGVPGASLALTLLNYRLTARELAYIIGNAAPRLLIVEPKYLEIVRQIHAEIPSVERVLVIGGDVGGGESYDDFIATGAAVPPERRPAEDDLCWLIYTSGTTGLPKGAMLSHRNLMSAVLNLISVWEGAPREARASGQEVSMYTFPQFHVTGHLVLMYHLRGWPMILLRNFDTQTLLRNVETWKVTTTGMAPTMIAMLLEDEVADRFDLSSLCRIIYGASSMPGEVLREALSRWPHIGFSTGFGMTELAGTATYMSPAEHACAAEQHLPFLRSAGRNMPLVRVRVVDDEGCDVQPGLPGEIVVKGDQVLVGYWRNPEATASSFVDGWFRTGDMGQWDEDGYVYVVDRKKDMILTGGENVYPREVEEILYEHPAVLDAAVVGTPDPKWGEKVVAVICTRPGNSVTGAEIIDFCRERIASYKKPSHVVFIEALPRNASGKVLKRTLRDQISTGDLALDE